MAELKTREPDEKNPYRARVVMVGSEIDDPDLIRLTEEAGAYVAADCYCLGSLPERTEIQLTDREDILTQICRHYKEEILKGTLQVFNDKGLKFTMDGRYCGAS